MDVLLHIGRKRLGTDTENGGSPGTLRSPLFGYPGYVRVVIRSCTATIFTIMTSG
jgi:hypothetical protein